MDTPETGKKHTNYIILAFVLGCILGAVVMWFAVGQRAIAPTTENGTENTVRDTPNGNGTTENTGTTNLSGDETNYVEVADQLAGDRVLLKKVMLSEPGWVVIHENHNGALGNALGAQRFDVGEYNDGYVELLRNTEVGNAYQALLYADNGDRVFNLESDIPLRNASGNLIGASFTVIRVDRKTE